MKNETITTKETLSRMRGRVTIRAYRAGTKELVQEIVQDNLVMQGSSTGTDLIIQRLLGTNTYSLNINYGAIGSGSTAPAISDTKLTTEVARTTVAYSQRSSATAAMFQFFFPDSVLANGTYPEFGMFVDATATANSGQIFNHALFTTSYTKVAGTDTTVEVDLSI